MRLIDADALKDGYMHMGYNPNEHPEESYMEGWCKGFNAAVDHCLHHVIHAPTIEPIRWIPCSERLPEDGVYIVYAPDYSGGSSSAKEYHDGVMFSKYKNGKWSIEHGYYKRPNCVIAWMLLPEPWRGESNDRT